MNAMSLQWAPLLPLWLIGGLAVAALLLVAVALWRRAAGVWWRGGAFAVLLLALANPSIIEEQRDPLSDVAFVVADDSASQDIEERRSQTEQAVAHLLAQIGALEDTEVRLIRAGDSDGALEVEGTRLFTPLRQALAKVPRQRVSAVILVRDGPIHDLPESLENLGIDAPVHLLLTGRPASGRASCRGRVCQSV